MESRCTLYFLDFQGKSALRKKLTIALFVEHPSTYASIAIRNLEYFFLSRLLT